MPQRKRKSTASTPTPPTEESVRHALDVIAKAPPAVFVAEHALRARFSAALALVAQAIVILDEVHASGDQHALEADGRLGDADLTGHAWEAADDLRSLLPRWSQMLTDWHEVRDVHLSAFRTDIEEEDAAGVEHYLSVAAAIAARWPTRRAKAVKP